MYTVTFFHQLQGTCITAHIFDKLPSFLTSAVISCDSQNACNTKAMTFQQLSTIYQPINSTPTQTQTAS